MEGCRATEGERMKLVIVTATTDAFRSAPCIASWGDVQTYVIGNGPTVGGPYLGTVPAFRLGVDQALGETDADIIACLHDDFEIHDTNWAERVIRHFERHPQCGLLGFGGAIGLGDTDIYQKPYAPMQLARIGFRSNLVDAEVHGMRSILPEPVACLDGFSQIGRREFWDGLIRPEGDRSGYLTRPWKYLEDLGMVHHFYDGALGCLARRYGWETWYLPMRGRHLGGQTAVGDAGYQEWAKTQTPGGDHGFWETAHQKAYEAFRDVLPLRV